MTVARDHAHSHQGKSPASHLYWQPSYKHHFTLRDCLQSTCSQTKACCNNHNYQHVQFNTFQHIKLHQLNFHAKKWKKIASQHLNIPHQWWTKGIIILFTIQKGNNLKQFKKHISHWPGKKTVIFLRVHNSKIISFYYIFPPRITVKKMTIHSSGSKEGREALFRIATIGQFSGFCSKKECGKITNL